MGSSAGHFNKFVFRIFLPQGSRPGVPDRSRRRDRQNGAAWVHDIEDNATPKELSKSGGTFVSLDGIWNAFS